jgi:hypothetical protein
VSNGNATKGKYAALMDMTKSIGHVFPQAPNFEAIKQKCTSKCYIDSPIKLQSELVCWYNFLMSPEDGVSNACFWSNFM